MGGIAESKIECYCGETGPCFEWGIRKVLIVVFLVSMLFSLSSCKTVQGIGKKIQWVGEKGEQAIE